VIRNRGKVTPGPPVRRASATRFARAHFFLDAMGTSGYAFRTRDRGGEGLITFVERAFIKRYNHYFCDLLP